MPVENLKKVPGPEKLAKMDTSTNTDVAWVKKPTLDKAYPKMVDAWTNTGVVEIVANIRKEDPAVTINFQKVDATTNTEPKKVAAISTEEIEVITLDLSMDIGSEAWNAESGTWSWSGPDDDVLERMKCYFCPKKFENMASLEVHMPIHTLEEHFKVT